MYSTVPCFGSDAKQWVDAQHCECLFVGLAQHSRVQLLGRCFEAHRLCGTHIAYFIVLYIHVGRAKPIPNIVAITF